MERERTKSRNIIYLEVLRIIALFMVMWNHSYEVGFTLFLANRNSRFYLAYIACSVLCKIGAPLFFMISGCLLLGKEESFRDLFFRRILKTIAIIVLYNLGYLLYYSRPLKELGIFVFSQEISEAGWFLYAYLVFLILLPILRKLVKLLSGKEYIAIWIVGVVCVTLLPILEFFFGWEHNEAFNLPELFAWNIFYPLMGYYCGKVLNVNTGRRRWAVGCSMLLLLSLLLDSIFLAYRLDLTGEYADGLFHRNFLPILTSCFFLLVRLALSNMKIPTLLANILQNLGACGYGVFLLEQFLRDKTAFFYRKCLEAGMMQIFAGWAWILFAMGVGYILVFGVRLIPMLLEGITKVRGKNFGKKTSD